MTALGFDLKKGHICWCVLTGTRELPVYRDHGRLNFTVENDRVAMCVKFHNLFLERVKECSPDIVAYRVSTNAPSVDKIAYLHFPYGLLNLACSELSVSTKEFNSRSFTSKALGFQKGKKPFDAVSQALNYPKPNWDVAAANAALAAWMVLDV